MLASVYLVLRSTGILRRGNLRRAEHQHDSGGKPRARAENPVAVIKDPYHVTTSLWSQKWSCNEAHEENSAPRQAAGRYSIHQATSMLEMESARLVLTSGVS